MELPPAITNVLHPVDGSCHPDWNCIAETIERDYPEAERAAVWDATCLAWVQAIRNQLGGSYQVVETPKLLILSAADPKDIEQTRRSYESVRRKVVATLGELNPGGREWKQVVLTFSSHEQYYGYIAHFYPEGDHPMSSGICLLSNTYVHLAFPTIAAAQDLMVLAHEMTHGMLAHLPLPKWLDEALAMRMEQVVQGTDEFLLTREQLDRHVEHWNDANIQEFWCGTSWNIPGDSVDLSYDLARILWLKIETSRTASRSKIIQLITAARWEDAGDDALQASLDLTLGDLVASFLGEGNWAPAPETWEPPDDSPEVR